MVVIKPFSLVAIFERTLVQTSYSTKILVAALTAALVPMGGLSWAFLSTESSIALELRLLLVVAMAILTTVFTVVGVRSLLRPFEALTSFVDTYVSTGEIEELPESTRDDLGELVRNTRNTILRLDLASKELAEASKVDALTGLPNRRFSAQRLQQDLARADRSRMPISVVSIDIDDFRRLNDKYGSAVGDACLLHFAELAKSCVREGDWVARWGGDEFLVLLWDANPRQAEAVINRVRKKLAQSEMALEAGIRLTASFGFTTYSPGEANFELFAKADAALYRAKRLGKNQSVGPTELKTLSA